MSPKYFVTIFMTLPIICLAGLDKTKAGPYDIVFDLVKSCMEDDKPTKGHWYMPLKLKKEKNYFVLNAVNLVMDIPFDDTIKLDIQGDQMTSNGWKENFFHKDFTNGCSFLYQVTPKLMKDILASMDYKGEYKCPTKAGTYNFTNFKLEAKIDNLPVYFYNKYRVHVRFIKNNELIGCILALGSMVPKKTRKGK